MNLIMPFISNHAAFLFLDYYNSNWEMIQMKKSKWLISLLSVFLFLSTTSSVFAANSLQPETEQIDLFKKYADELQVTEAEPYKEVYVPEEGVILFNSISIVKDNSSKQNRISTASNQETYYMSSSQGVKNLFGYELYRLDYTTKWTFDYDKVISSSSTATTKNGFGWSYKSSSDGQAVIKNNGKQHEWTGTGTFAMVVGGIDIGTETLINHHRVNHDGTYEWKYETL